MKTKMVITHIVEWLKNYAKNANVNGFVVGVSGGVDSAVTSTLCAMTGMEVMCLEMPIHQAESHVSRAQEHIAQLKKRFPNVNSTRVDLTPVFDSFKTEINLEGNSSTVDMALANSRARLRMTTLYYYAGLLGKLVAGTGNKVEDFGVGFYTKYGDGGVDLSPIADLLKSEVYDLGSALEIPQSILTAAPSDGLFGDARSDEDQIGASYPELEWAMKAVENGKTVNDFEGRERTVFEIYSRYNTANKHKMNPIPVCEIPENLKTLKSMIRVLVADHQPIVSYGIRMLFENSSDIKIVNTANSAKQLLEYLKKSNTDIVLMSIDLTDVNGITVLRTIKKDFRDVSVIVFSTHTEDIYAISAIKAGASGYLSKTVNTSTIKSALLKVFKGGIYVSKELAQSLTFEKNTLGTMDLYKKLSTREVEVLKLISSGKRNKDIADQLNINEKTVSTYKLRLMKKLNVSNLVELIDHGRQKK